MVLRLEHPENANQATVLMLLHNLTVSSDGQSEKADPGMVFTIESSEKMTRVKNLFPRKQEIPNS